MAPSDDNQRIYEDTGVIDIYRTIAPPQQAERNMFEPLSDELRTGRLLDIGIGAGRTTAYLAPKVGHYVGVDYSHGLVRAAAQLYPDSDIRWCDARDMSQFEDASFDFVNFSFNGLDSLDHDGRRQVLAEVHRVLRPGGHWMFSSHNRDYVRRGMLPWQGRFKPGRVMLRKSAEALRHHRNWRHLRKEQVETPEYALVNDEAHHYSLLHYYISPTVQVAQLEAAGFTDVRVYDQWGTETAEPSPASIWMYYDSRRA
ncbi:class I SAM-dependent methyltransferase [Nocardioides astragali]|uniref:Class I SAM-dependent methyltransferase n=1 Tax=Nocardioides astragali TaxID=1776736 RepID=A0ABW2N5J8_9ACTN|nr:class I SAM-dependent methyltransferase [Nocardioides astragali]